MPDVTNLKTSDIEGMLKEGGFQIVATDILEARPLNYFVVAKRM